jgi:hypothetical protein
VRVRQSPSLPDGRGASHRGETARYRDVFAVAEFRALWAAQVLSVGGDQLARVALTVLVYAHTGSALLAAAAYAASIAPQFLGGLLLSGLADRWPRRRVMIVCDLARVPLAALMAVPGTPTAVLIGLLCAVTALGAPFGSARAAIVPDVLGDAFPLGTAITMTTYQAAQVAGFVAGGAVVGFFGARTAICIDAGTFLASAAIVALGVRHRPAPAAVRTAAKNGESLLATARLLLGQRAVRVPLLLGLLSAAYNVPEAIAVPLARAAGGGPVAARVGSGPRGDGPDHARRAGDAAADDGTAGLRRLRHPDGRCGAARAGGNPRDLGCLGLVRLIPGRRERRLCGCRPRRTPWPGIRASDRWDAARPGRGHDPGRSRRFAG